MLQVSLGTFCIILTLVINTLKGFRTPVVSEFFFVLSWECNKSGEFLECKKPNLPFLEGPGSKWKAVTGFKFPC